MSVPVPQAELNRLWSRYRSNRSDQDRNALAIAYAWIVPIIVSRHFSNDRTENREDLAQEGWIGLLQAVELYDASRGIEFTSYAFRAVLQKMRRYKAQKARMIRVSEHRGVLHGLLLRLINIFVVRHGREPVSDQELSNFLGCSEALIRMVKQTCAFEVTALDTPIGNQRLVDLIVDTRVNDPMTIVVGLSAHQAICSNTIEQAMAQLTPKQREVFQRYVVECQTLEEIALATKKSRQAVHHLLQKAIVNLRRALGVNDFTVRPRLKAPAPLC